MVIWITGMSAAGKTTLCNSISKLVKPRMPELVVIDGDIVRSALGNDLDYTEVDRKIQIQRIQGLSHELSQQGLVVLVAALYSHPDLLRWNRENINPYFEVYLEAPMTLLRQRDPKELYAKAKAGEMPNVVGVDIPWNAPQSPDMVFDTTVESGPDEMARQVISRVPRLASCLGAGIKNA